MKNIQNEKTSDLCEDKTKVSLQDIENLFGEVMLDGKKTHDIKESTKKFFGDSNVSMMGGWT